MGTKRTGTIVAIILLIAAVAIKVYIARPESTFSIEGEWLNTGTAAMGVDSDSKLIADNKFCRWHGEKEAYVIKKDGSGGYTLKTKDASGQIESYCIEVYDNDSIALKRGSSVLSLQRIKPAAESTCTLAPSEDGRHKY